jgi:CPA1 family monovalent cation:H+ antiporter
MQFLQEKYSEEQGSNEYLQNLLARFRSELNFFQQNLEDPNHPTRNTLTNYQRIYLELLDQQRRLLNRMNRRAEFDEELIRKYLALVDLEELKIRERGTNRVEPE